jgi:hypothetical protein
MSDEENSEISILQPGSDGIGQIMSAVSNLSEGGTYHEPLCLFCCSPNRSDAERIFSEQDYMVKNPEERVSQYFSSVGEVISEDAVRNHVRSHMRKGDMELRKVEYLSRIANLSDLNMTTIAQINMARAVVLDCLASAGEIVPTKKLSAAKAAETKAAITSKMVKMWTDLMVLEGKISEEMEERGEVIALPKDGFFSLFDQLLLDAKTKEESKMIHSIMTKITSLFQ